MIITTQYIYIFFLSLFLTLFAWFLESNWMVKRCGPNHFKTIRNIAVIFLVLLLIWLAVINFAATLTVLVFGSGVVALIDLLFCRRARLKQNYREPLIVEHARSFFWILLFVWVVRSFVIQPYRVPTPSLQPTVQPGDFLVVNQFAYGLRFPVLNTELVKIGEPKRGDIALFYYPVDPSFVFVKRVIGVPGDHIEYKHKVLYVNGQEMKQTDLGLVVDGALVHEKEEDLAGVKHKIYLSTGPLGQPMLGDFSVDVPEGAYFMMGDNRDGSDDSRAWGFVPQANLIGKAFGIWMSWDALLHRIRWERIGEAVK